jgi:hypothetical protein
MTCTRTEAHLVFPHCKRCWWGGLELRAGGRSDVISVMRALLCRFNVASSIETYWGLHVKFPIFLSDFDRVWMFSTDFYKRLQCQILRKSDGDITKAVGALHDRPGVKTVTSSGGVEWRVVSCNWPMTHKLRYINKVFEFLLYEG